MNKAFGKTLAKVFQNMVGFMVLSTILIVTFGVAARLCQIPVAWTDETLKIIFIWLVFINAAIAFNSDSLIGLDLVEDLLSKYPSVKRILKFVQAVFALIFGVFMMIQTFQIVTTQFASGETTPVMQFPLWLTNLGYFIGCTMFAAIAAWKLVKLLGSAKPGKSPEHPED